MRLQRILKNADAISDILSKRYSIREVEFNVPARELIREQNPRNQGQCEQIACFFSRSFKDAFYNAYLSSSLNGAFVLIVVRTSHRAYVFVSSPRPLRPFHEDKLNGRMVDRPRSLFCTTRFADFFAFVVLSPTNPKTRTTYARSDLRCSTTALAVSLLFIRNIPAWCRSIVTIHNYRWNHCAPDIAAKVKF